MSRKLCQEVHKIVTTTDLKNDYKLRDQINASSGSIMDNIAEGFERGGKNEFRQFLSIAKGSCGECRSQLYRIYDRKYITKEIFESRRDETIIISKKISSFIIYLNDSNYNGVKYKK